MTWLTWPSWHQVHGFLIINFLLHLLAFVVVYRRRQKPRYLWLCGTFAALTILFSLKFLSLNPSAFGVSTQVAVRLLAISCTTMYVFTWWRQRRK